MTCPSFFMRSTMSSSSFKHHEELAKFSDKTITETLACLIDAWRTSLISSPIFSFSSMNVLTLALSRALNSARVKSRVSSPLKLRNTSDFFVFAPILLVVSLSFKHHLRFLVSMRKCVRFMHFVFILLLMTF